MVDIHQSRLVYFRVGDKADLIAAAQKDRAERAVRPVLPEKRTAQPAAAKKPAKARKRI